MFAKTDLFIHRWKVIGQYRYIHECMYNEQSHAKAFTYSPVTQNQISFKRAWKQLSFEIRIVGIETSYHSGLKDQRDDYMPKKGQKDKHEKKKTQKTNKQFFLGVSIKSALQCTTYLLNTMGIRILKYIDILMSWSAIPKADADMDIYIATSTATCLKSISDQNKQHTICVQSLYEQKF